MTNKSIPKISLLILISGYFLLNYSCKKNDEDDPGTPQPIPSVLFSDDFNQAALKDGWFWANEPGVWDVNTTRTDFLHFIGNFDANTWCEDNSSMLYQVISSDQDFDVYARMHCLWGNNTSDIAGLMCKSATSGDWVILKFWMHGDLTGRLEFQTQCNDIISPVPGSELNGGDAEFFLRLKKTGHDYSTYFKFTEGEDWTLIGDTQFPDQLPLHIGIFGGVDNGDGELQVEIDYFRINP